MGSDRHQVPGSAPVMGEIVNLRLARKAKARYTAERQAEQNRALHGRSKPEKERQKREAERSARLLDGAKREQDD